MLSFQLTEPRPPKFSCATCYSRAFDCTSQSSQDTTSSSTEVECSIWRDNLHPAVRTPIQELDVDWVRAKD
ncbi:hypothetical protein Pcinc_033938 [Petrolisthes cinctipes]|uniref:Uncharacterized protein n=1 Tax=Petrolisthes cinctipes TaxID=88211 RepID=A0AAE1ERD9_PETCI|nr:hypothetical protein Pcinc_033938 [Petrolisthes cinctipes]